jgi:hypothetical protein
MKQNRTKEWNQKIAKALIGNKNGSKTRSPEWKEKIRVALNGHKVSEATRKKQSDKAKLRTGEKSTNWQGGKSFEKYTVDWTQTLKRAIRERDNYVCQICGKEPSTHVHHIDYNKKNCNPENLITLCVSCHSKTNNHRNDWIKYFTVLIKGRSEI